jgi:hypothetical protein
LSIHYRGTVLEGPSGSWQFHTSQRVTSPGGVGIQGARVTLYFTEKTQCSGTTEDEEKYALRATTDANGGFEMETLGASDPWMKTPALFCVTHSGYETLPVRVILQDRAGPWVDFVLEPAKTP